MGKKLLLGMALAVSLTGVSSAGEIKDLCGSPKEVYSKYLLDKCYANYFQAIKDNRKMINDLRDEMNRRFAEVDQKIDQLRSDLQSQIDDLRREIEALKITSQERVKVLFGFDKFTLTAEAKSALDDFISSIKGKNLKEIVVVGFADTTGTSKYNFGLSLRRAQNVAAYLVQQGLPIEKIKITGYGEELASMLGDEKPQQRAVEVIAIY